MLDFGLFLVSGLLLILPGWSSLASPYVFTIASLIPPGISLGIAKDYHLQWKSAYTWFASVGFLAIAVFAITNPETLKTIAIPLFHGVAGFVIFLEPFFAKDAPKGFWWTGIGSALIGTGAGVLNCWLTIQLLLVKQAFATI